MVLYFDQLLITPETKNNFVKFRSLEFFYLRELELFRQTYKKTDNDFKNILDSFTVCCLQ